MVATIHAKTATVFVALAVRDKAVSRILATTTMIANDIFLFTHATGFRHSVLPPLVSVQHENSITQVPASVNKKKQGPTPWKCGGFFPA